MILTELYQESTLTKLIDEKLQTPKVRLHVDGMTGSLPAVTISALAQRRPTVSQLVIAPSKEEAYYLQNDLEALMGNEHVMLFPTSYRKAYHYDPDQTENANILMRTEVVKALGSSEPVIVISFPEALSEKVVAQRTFAAKSLRLARGGKMDMWDLVERLQELGFEREDFVVEPGQYAVRGGIVDVYSFGSDLPFRIEFFDEEVDSLRTYDTVSQLSVKQLDRIDIIPKMSNMSGQSDSSEEKVCLMEYFGSEDVVWVQSLMMAAEQMEKILADTRKEYESRLVDKEHPIAGTLPKPEDLSCPANEN